MARATPTPQPTAVLLTIRFRARSREEFLATYYRDVKRGGMLIRTRVSHGISIGTHVRFRFVLAEGSTIFSGIGRVAWLQPEAECLGIGIQFTALAPRSGRLYYELLARNEGTSAHALLQARAEARAARQQRRLAALGLGTSAEFFAAPAALQSLALRRTSAELVAAPAAL